MCKLQKTLETLDKVGEKDKFSPAMTACLTAMADDINTVVSKYSLAMEDHSAIAARLVNVEKDGVEIKLNMTTKSDLKEALSELRAGFSEDLKNSARFTMIEDMIKSWKFWLLLLVIIGVAAGPRYLEFLVNIAKIAV